MDPLDRIKTLIALANSDGKISEKERQYILTVGQANHMLVAEILPLFSIGNFMPQPRALNDDQKESLLLEVVQLMRIDEKVYKTELLFCAQVAARLGYREEIVFELMLLARTLKPNDKEGIHQMLKRYVKN